MGGEIFFVADDGIHGEELWKLDSNGITQMVADIKPQDDGNSRIRNLTVVGNTLFFSANDGNGERLWKSNGTAGSTQIVGDFTPKEMVAYNGKLFFSGLDLNDTTDPGYLGYELFSSDGTAAGTVLVKDIKPVTTPIPFYPDFNSDPRAFQIVGPWLTFFAKGPSGVEFYRTDGTTAGTMLVKDIYVDPTGLGASNSFASSSSVVLNDTMYFAARSYDHGAELWKSDGTEAGTSLVADLRVGPDNSSPTGFIEVDNEIYFTAFLGGADRRIFKTDGTTSGTIELGGGTFTDGLVTLGELNGQVLYAARERDLGFEIISTSGTPETTQVLKTIFSDTVNVGDMATSGIRLGDSLYFGLNEGSIFQLWRTDGTAAGTEIVDSNLDLQVVGHPFATYGSTENSIYFAANDGLSGRELWSITSPTADIGGPYSGDEGTLIALSASGSLAATSFEWDLDNDGQYDDATGENVNFNATDDGVFTIGLRINGVGGPTDSTTVMVNNIGPVTSMAGPTELYRGESVTFTLTATDPLTGSEAGLFDFEIDWDGDSIVDQTLLGVTSGTTVQHSFPATTTNNIQVRATNDDDRTGYFSQTPITVSPYVLRDDGFGGTNLIWGGTPSLDAVFFLGSPTTLAMFVQLEDLVLVNRLDLLGDAVNGKIIVHGYGGGDVIVGELVSGIPLEVHGGDGDDVLVGGMWSDELFGDGGNDILLGGTQATDGFDMLFGGEGNDTLFGHYGADLLNGGGGEDLLISDQFSFSNVPQAVLQIGEEWKSARPFAERVTNILGVTSTGVNGSSILDPGVNILADGSLDTLIGGIGDLDWFFYDFDQDFFGGGIEPDEEETDSDP